MKKPPNIILCGGMGTRPSEETDNKPKLMVEIGSRPKNQLLIGNNTHT